MEFWRSVTEENSVGNSVRDPRTDTAFRGGVAHIWLDAPVEADLSDSTGQIGAAKVWAGGNTGQGVEVAVLDTGVDAGHPDLADRIAARQSFVPDENIDDRDGHGTHVASTIAGTGAASDGKEKGVARGARPSIGKVLDNSGRGQISWTLAAMEWATVERHAKIVNMTPDVHPGGLTLPGPGRRGLRQPAARRVRREFRYDWIPGSGWTFGAPQPEPVSGARTDWVSSGDYRWNQEAYAGGVVYEIGAKTAYRPGSRQSEAWFRPTGRPHLNEAYRSPLRIGDSMAIDVPAWGSRDRIGLSQDDTGATTQHMTLSQGGTTLGEGVFSLVERRAPGPGKLPYRLVVTGEREAPFTPYSSSTRTQWDFASGAAANPEAKTVLPLVQLDYRVELDGTGRAKRHATVTVTAAHLPGAAHAGRLGAPTLELSYDDGRTWHRADRTGDGGFRLDAPRRAEFVTMRAGARDTVGNTVHQTVTRAFGLR